MILVGIFYYIFLFIVGVGEGGNLILFCLVIIKIIFLKVGKEYLG